MSVLPEKALDFVQSEDGMLLREDVICWIGWYGPMGTFGERLIGGKLRENEDLRFGADLLFGKFSEFRSLVDYRLLGVPDLRKMVKQISLPRATELHLTCPVIGPRFRIQHGFNTFLFAREVGSDFWINHNVTVGAHRGTPIIGNRVTIRTGAVVVGPITVGDDAYISANAVVSQDMPAATAAYAPRTVFVPRKGY